MGLFLCGILLGMFIGVLLIGYMTPEKVLEAQERMETWQRIVKQTDNLREKFKATMRCDECGKAAIQPTDLD